MKKILLLWIAVVCLASTSFAQLHHAKAHQSQIPVKIGDKVPDLTLLTVFNHTTQKTKLSDLYKGGGLIINFWATWCVPCVQELPILNQMVQTFHGKLNILSVAYEDSAVISKFKTAHPEIDLSQLHMITNDTLLVEYFKHRSLPYNIWIDSTGAVKHTTWGEEMTEQNLRGFLDHKPLQFHEAKELRNWKMEDTFHLRDSSFSYRSIISGYAHGIISGFVFNDTTKPKERLINRIFVFNLPLSQLYRIAYSEMSTGFSMMDYHNLVEFDKQDSIRYFAPRSTSNFLKNSKYASEQAWSEDHAYCYELTLPRAVKDSVFFGYMQDDLQRNFHLKIAQVEKDKMCSIITINKNDRKKWFPRSVKDSSFFKITPQGIQAEHITLTRLFENLNVEIRPGLNVQPTDPPYVNETGIDYPIDLDIAYSKEKPTYSEVKALIEKKYGLKFKLESRRYPVFVIKD